MRSDNGGLVEAERREIQHLSLDIANDCSTVIVVYMTIKKQSGYAD